MKKHIKIFLGLLFIIIFGLIIGLYGKYTPDYQKNIFNLSTLIGGYISAYGLFVAILQIFALQAITQSTQTAVKETKEKVEQILSISDLAKIVANIRFIEECINSDKYELAKLRLCDVKDFMTRVEFIKRIEFDREVFGRLKKRVEIGLSNLDKQINNKGKLDKIIFCQDMEEVATILSTLENQLKSK
ncbi:hypothetical protein [uncultured Alistipes sp.]|uniref:hypothetical protein n=1 Tax=uncultured Alistipes sp. TaxID=538949 RepID=UPI0025A9AE1D|nr:hypothetical protein [uncultured Alistipes sp.]